MEKTWWSNSSTSCHLIGIFVTAMVLIITTTSGINYHKLKINGWNISGSVRYLIWFLPYQRLIHFLFYATLSTVGYVGRGCLCYWNFIRSWCDNLLTIYILGKGGGGLSSCQNPFIGWWLHQVTREDIRIGDVFALQQLSINNTTADFNVKSISTCCVCTQECGYAVIVMFSMF